MRSLLSSIKLLVGGTAVLASTTSLPQAPEQPAAITSTTKEQQPYHRSLAIGDFDEFNALFQGAIIRMGEQEIEVSEKIGLVRLDLTLRNIRCYNIAVGDIAMSHGQPNLQTTDVTVSIMELDLECALDYRYKYGPLRGGGNAVIETDNNSLSSTLRFTSPDFVQGSPPTSSELQACTTNIEITNMDFDGDFVTNIIEVFERLIRNVVEEKVEGVACEELGSLGGTFVSDMLAIAQETMDPHLLPMDNTVTNPLYAESTITIPNSMTLMNFQDTENIIGKWFNQMLGEVDTLLGTEVSDPNSPTGNGRDLGINLYLRDFFLEDDRSFQLAIEDLPNDIDAILFQGHDKLTQTTITLDQVKIFGLDTMTRFEPLVRIGKYTLQNELSWQYLTMEFQVTVDIQPSTLEDSILENPSSKRIVEKINIDFGVDNVNVIASLLLAIDQDLLGSLELGPMLYTDNLMKCLLSVVYQTQVSGLEVQIGNLREPTLTNFVSPGIDRVVSDSVEAAFAMYENAILRAIPSIFQTSIRTVINTNVIDKYLEDDSKTICPTIIVDDLDQFVDWRDMLLSPQWAAASGATGLEPYGDLAGTVAELLREQFLTVTDVSTGLLELNSLIRSSTLSQSGEEGTLRFPSDMLAFTKTDIANTRVASFVEKFELKLFDTRVQNLDVLKAPVSILQPQSAPFELANILTFGTVPNRPINITMGFLLALEGPDSDPDSPFAMNHEMDVSVSIPSASVSADFLATVETSKLLQFPLKDILNSNCLLATMPPPTLDANGVRVESQGGTTSLALERFALTLGTLDVDVNFLRTSDSPGIAIIPDLLDTLKNVHATSTLNYRLKEYVEHILRSSWVQTQLDHSLAEAPKFCPHSPEYDASAVATEYESSSFPELTPNAIDTILFAGALVFDMSFLVLMESHRLRPVEVTYALSAQDSFVNIFEMALVDWTNLNRTQIGSFVDMALREGRSYLGGTVTDAATGIEDLGINVVLRDFLFGEGSDDFQVEFDDVEFEMPGVQVSMTSLRIKGLDSITEFEFWEPIAPQTVNNKVSWDELALEVDLSVKNATTGATIQTFKASLIIGDVDVEVPLFVTIDQDKLGQLEIGSFLFTEEIVQCLLTVVDTIESTQMLISAGRLDDPVFTGLLVNTDAVIKSFTENAFVAYRAQVLAAVPQLFDTTIRKVVNRMIGSYIGEALCQKGAALVTEMSPFIDFRKFFDEEAMVFGNLPPLLRDLVDTELLSVDPDTGLPRINDALIAPLTESQSGLRGSVLVAGDVFGLDSKSIPELGFDSIELRAFDPRISNLDTVRPPLEIIQPNETSPFLLDNTVRLGIEGRPLGFEMKTVFALEGDPAFEMRNELNFAVEIPEADFFATIWAQLGTEAFLSFPLEDVMNSDCWLAILSTPQLDSNGLRSQDVDPGLAMKYVAFALLEMRFDVSCASCTSPGLEALPRVLETLNEAGISSLLQGRLVDLALELLQSDYMQAFIDRMTVDGSKRCPHSPDFVSTDATSEWPGLGFPALTYDSLETVAFASTFLLNVAAVVIADSHSQNVTAADPLSGQKQLDNPADVRLLDFTSLEDSIGEWADVAKEEVTSYLSKTVADPKGPGGRDLNINTLLRSLILEEDGTLALEFNNLEAGNGDMQVSLKGARVVGLDSISNFNILDTIGPQTLRNEIGLRRLGVSLTVSMMTSDVSDSGRMLQTEEDLTITLELEGVNVALSMLLALDLDLLGSLELASLLDIGNILPCFLSSARAANLTELQVSVGAIDFSVQGFRSAEVGDAVAESTRIILEKFGDVMLKSLPGFFDTSVRALMNNWISYYLGEDSSTSCPSKAFETTKQRFVDFRDLFLSGPVSLAYGGSGTSPYGDLVRTALDIAKDFIFDVDPATGLSAVNDMILGPLTRSQSGETGSIVFPGDLFNSGTRVSVGGLDAQVKLRASDLRVNNLDSVGSPLSVLEAVNGEANLLNNTATFGVDHPLSFGVRFLISLIGDDNMQISNDLDIGLDMYTANVILTALLKVEESKFLGFPLRDIQNLDCWLATIPAPRLDSRGVPVEGEEATVALAELAANIAQLNLNISCVTCSSPRMYELTELLSKPEAKEDATDAANLVLDYVTQLMGGPFLQVKMDRMLNDAAKRCPHSPAYDPQAQGVEYQPFENPTTESSITFLILLGGVALGLIFSVSILVAFIKCFVTRRHKNWLRSLPSHQTRRLLRQQEREQERESELNANTKSMFLSPDIPVAVRWLMPVVILVNIGFFLSGHLSLGATVNIEAELAGERFRVEKFFEFSMAQSTVDIWKAGGKELAIMILIFSGIWPYVKQIMTLVIWFLPPTRLPISKRGSTLLWIDWLGKWSFVDIFVLVISIAAFRVGIVSPAVGFLPNNFYSINLLVVPLWGLYANMIAQLVSQVSSHFIIHYHRRIANNAMDEYKARHQLVPAEANKVASGDEQDSIPFVPAEYTPEDTWATPSESNQDQELLNKHQFGRPHRGESEKLVALPWVDISLRVVVMILLVLVIIGCVLPSFSLEILGIIGVAVESGQQFQDATTKHSIFTVIKLLFEEARFLDTVGDYIGLGTLSVVLLFTVLIVPIVQALALLRQWFYPLTRKVRTRQLIVIEMLQAWQYAEVYLIAIFVASWQLGPISQFMINSYCDGLKESFAQMVYYGILKEEDAQCFSVQSSIEGGSYILAAAAVLLALLNTFVGKAVLQYFRDKEELEKKSLDIENASWKSEDTFIGDFEQSSRVEQTDGIQPLPVLFTDTFRWVLQSDTDNSVHSSIAPSTSSRDQVSGPPMSAFAPGDKAYNIDADGDDKSCNIDSHHTDNDGFVEKIFSAGPEIQYQENEQVLDEVDIREENPLVEGSAMTIPPAGGLIGGQEEHTHSSNIAGGGLDDEYDYKYDCGDDLSRMSSEDFGAHQPPDIRHEG